MRMLKKILLTLLVIVLLLVVIAYLLPRHAHVERTKVMAASPEAVFEQVNTLKNWEKWSAWHRKDPNMKLVYEGPASGAGAVYKWESDKSDVGNGMLKIVSSTPYDSLKNEMYFMESKDPAFSKFTFAKSDSGTKVTWTMDADMGMNPMMRWMGLFMDKMVGPDFESGLARIDSITKMMPANNGASSNTKIEEMKVEAKKVVTVRDSGATKDIPAMLGKMYGEIGAEMQKNGVQQTGPVFAIYHFYSPERIDMEAGVPVDKVITTDKKGRVRSWEMPAGNAVVAHYYGAYDKMDQTYGALQSYLKEHNKTLAGPMWEEYVTDPGVEKDTAKWYSRIYYPVR